jgi:hypothetical protein
MSDSTRSPGPDSRSGAGPEEDPFAGRLEARAAGNEPLAPTSVAGRDAELPKTTEDLRQASLWSDAWRQLRRNKLFVVAASLLAVLALMAAFPQLFLFGGPGPNESCELANSKLPPGTNGALFGYDVFGCDYYANVIYGARVSMIIGVFVMGGAMVIGVVLGGLAGFFGGWFDTLIARITDVVYGLPLILGAILILNAFTDRGLLQVGIALIALSWMTFLRLFRSTAISVKETDYVSAARAMARATCASCSSTSCRTPSRRSSSTRRSSSAASSPPRPRCPSSASGWSGRPSRGACRSAWGRSSSASHRTSSSSRASSCR